MRRAHQRRLKEVRLTLVELLFMEDRRQLTFRRSACSRAGCIVA